MDKADDVFVKEFSTILAILVVFTIGMFFLARGIHANALEEAASRPAAVEERIQPVGQVETKK